MANQSLNAHPIPIWILDSGATDHLAWKRVEFVQFNQIPIGQRSINVRARHGASYFIIFIDDLTCFGHVYLISHKSEALDCFRRYVNLVENQFDKSIKALRTD